MFFPRVFSFLLFCVQLWHPKTFDIYVTDMPWSPVASTRLTQWIVLVNWIVNAFFLWGEITYFTTLYKIVWDLQTLLYNCLHVSTHCSKYMDNIFDTICKYEESSMYYCHACLCLFFSFAENILPCVWKKKSNKSHTLGSVLSRLVCHLWKKPLFKAWVLHFLCSSQPMHLGKQQGMAKYLVPCHLHGRLMCSSRLLTLAILVPVIEAIQGVNQLMENSLFLSLTLLYKLINNS